MDIKDISNICNQFIPKKMQWRCILSDELPNYQTPDIKKNEILIINTLTARDGNVMGHWVLIYRTHKELFYFDSFGLNIKSYNSYIYNYFDYYKKKLKRITWKVQIQDVNTLCCGLHIIFVIYKIIQCNNVNFGVRKLREIYHHKNFIKNDKLVTRFLFSRFKNIKTCPRMLCDEVARNICQEICFQ